MTPYSCMTREELEREYGSVLASYEACKAQGLNLNMARGKPAKKQLDLVSGLLTVLQTPEDCFDDGVDARNYGELAGIPSARRYWADVLGCKADQVFVGGAASPEYDVRRGVPCLHPRPAPQPQAMVPGGKGEISLPRPRI